MDTRQAGGSLAKVAAVVSAGSRLSARVLVNCLESGLDGPAEVIAEVVRSSDDATEAAQLLASGTEIVIAVGGDGTVADVASGILGSGAALGIIPAGSTNITAKSLGIPTRIRDAVALITGAHVRRPIDVGLSGDRCFLHIGGAGFDAEIFRGASREWKSRVGWLAYLPPAATAIGLPPSQVSIVADDVRFEARSSLVLVANGGAAIAPTFRLHPEITNDDGWLDLLIFTATNPAEIIATLGRLGSQRLDRSPHVIWRRAKTIDITAIPPLSVELDGDVRGTTPRRFAIASHALEVITPT